ncbi:NmrA/HSCARG family protein [Actinoplanes awajinensis]|uniref:NmrA-like domain-containing protein n=1 Tax=Actinoplanes awajinensis subsp. mycoplanecinus TaxID=135947 RepID=A0A0X3VA87_9ACTN|nr:NmrA/HSCARG family protein [Actinoplanes awajinensis]KUL41504.1 hypothetical protein ADL15_04445 [Actinoplanes awajinensis subsp. mycoplanecinus]
MSSPKLITVVGATGAQGGGVTRALLADGTFTVRAVTRDAGSPKARALAELGAEVVTATLDDRDSLRAAFDGAYGAFLVTPYWEHRSPEREIAEVQNLIGAARGAELRHVLWSTLEDTRAAIPAGDERMPLLDGGYRVPHFDVKGGTADALFAESGLPVTYLLMSFYWENLLGDLAPQRDPDGKLALHLAIGDAAIAGVALDDLGAIAARALRRPAETIGATIPVATEHLTGEQIAVAFARTLGELVVYRPPTHDQLRGLGFPGADELGNMFQYYAEFSEHALGLRGTGAARAMQPRWRNLTEFLTGHRSDVARVTA